MESTLGFAAFAVEAIARSCRPKPATGAVILRALCLPEF